MNAIRPGVAGTAVVLVVAVCCIAAAAGEKYARSLAPAYSTSGMKIGDIMPGSGVAVSGASPSKRTTVTIDGWSIEGADSVIYSAVGQRIIVAAFDEGAVTHAKSLGEKRDAYGTTWKHVHVTVAVDTAQLTTNVASVWSAAHTLYAARCSACHALHSPTEFTANQWPSILTTMTKNAALDPAQAALVRQYLQTHARTH
jgi:diheme cytochrome c